MRRSIVFLSVVAFLLSCGSSVPKDVLPRAKMRSVLWDMMQADGMAEYYSAKDTSFRGLAKHVNYYNQVFAIHKISKEQFSKSLVYYENHPSDFKIILDSLHNYAQRLQTAADTLKRPGQAPPVDSLKRRPPLIMHH